MSNPREKPSAARMHHVPSWPYPTYRRRQTWRKVRQNKRQLPSCQSFEPEQRECKRMSCHGGDVIAERQRCNRCFGVCTPAIRSLFESKISTHVSDLIAAAIRSLPRFLKQAHAYTLHFSPVLALDPASKLMCLMAPCRHYTQCQYLMPATSTNHPIVS